MKFSTKQVSFGYWHAHYETKSAKITIFGGFPKFWQGIPDNDIIISEKRHVLAPKQDCERIHDIIAPSQEGGGRPSCPSLKDFKCFLFNNDCKISLDIRNRNLFRCNLKVVLMRRLGN